MNQLQRVESIMLHRSSILKMLFRHQGWILFSTYSSILLVGADNAAPATTLPDWRRKLKQYCLKQSCRISQLDMILLIYSIKH